MSWQDESKLYNRNAPYLNHLKGSTTVSLTPDQVRNVAMLARLQLEDTRVDEYARELSGILNVVDALDAANTDDVAPMAHPLDLHARLRADEVTEEDQREAFQAIAPAVEDGVYLVPKVIE